MKRRHSAYGAEKYRRLPLDTEDLNGLIDTAETRESANANLVLGEAFTVGFQGFVVEHTLRQKCVVRDRKFRSRRLVEIEDVERFAHRLDNPGILRAKRRGQKLLQARTGEKRARREVSEKLAAIFG